MKNSLINDLDKYAEQLEIAGLPKYAARLDEVSNSLEKKAGLTDYLKSNKEKDQKSNSLSDTESSDVEKMVDGGYLKVWDEFADRMDSPSVSKLVDTYFKNWERIKGALVNHGIDTRGSFRVDKFKAAHDKYEGLAKLAADRDLGDHKRELEGVFKSYNKGISALADDDKYLVGLTKFYHDQFLNLKDGAFTLLEGIVKELGDVKVESGSEKEKVEWFFSKEGIGAIKDKIQSRIVGPFKFKKDEDKTKHSNLSEVFTDKLVSEWKRVREALHKFGISPEKGSFDGGKFWERFQKFEGLVKFAADDLGEMSEELESIYKEIENTYKAFESGLSEYKGDDEKVKGLSDTYHELIMSEGKGFYNKAKDAYEESEKAISSLEPEKISPEEAEDSEKSEEKQEKEENEKPKDITHQLIAEVDGDVNKEILKHGHYQGLVNSFKHLAIAPETIRKGESARRERDGHKDAWVSFLKGLKRQLDELDKAQDKAPEGEILGLLNKVISGDTKSPVEKKKQLLAMYRVSMLRSAHAWKDFMSTAMDFASFEGASSSRGLKDVLQGRMEGIGGPVGLFEENLSESSKARKNYAPAEFTEEAKKALKKVLGVYLDPSAFMSDKIKESKNKEESLKDSSKPVTDRLEDGAEILKEKQESGDEEGVEGIATIIRDNLLPAAKEQVSGYYEYLSTTNKVLDTLDSKLAPRFEKSISTLLTDKDTSKVDKLISDLEGIFEELKTFSQKINIPNDAAREGAVTFFDSIINDIKGLADYLIEIKNTVESGDTTEDQLKSDISMHVKTISSIMKKVKQFKDLIGKISGKDEVLSIINNVTQAAPIEMKPADITHTVLPVLEKYQDAVTQLSKAKMPKLEKPKFEKHDLPDYKSVMNALNKHTHLTGYLNVAKDLAEKISQQGEMTEDDKRAVTTVSKKIKEEVAEEKESSDHYKDFLSEMETELGSLRSDLDDVSGLDVEASEKILDKASQFLKDFPDSETSISKDLKSSIDVFVKDLEGEFEDIKDSSRDEAKDRVDIILKTVSKVKNQFENKVDVSKVTDLVDDITNWLGDAKQAESSYLDRLGDILSVGVAESEDIISKNNKLTKTITGEGLDLGESKSKPISNNEADSKTEFISKIRNEFDKALSRFSGKIFDIEDEVGESDELNEFMDLTAKVQNAVDRVDRKDMPGDLYKDLEKKINKVIELINSLMDPDNRDKDQVDLARKVSRALGKVVDEHGRLVMYDRNSVKKATGVDARNVVASFLSKKAAKGKVVETHEYTGDNYEPLPGNYMSMDSEKKEKSIKRALGAIAARNGSKQVGLDVHKMFTGGKFKVVDRDLGPDKEERADRELKEKWDNAKMKKLPAEKKEKGNPNQTNLF